MQAQQKEFMKFFDHNRGDFADAKKRELVNEVLRQFGTVRVRVAGHSMVPSLWPGDTLLIERTSIEDISKGDLLLYRREGRFFVHRVTALAESPQEFSITAWGDALPAPDLPISKSEVLGTVCQVLRNRKYSKPRSRLKYGARLIGILGWHSDVFMRLVVLAHSFCTFCGRADDAKP
jgi:signal peptidase I